MQIGEDAKLEAEEYQFPSSLTMWTCIGCGAMGNFQDCSGTCAYRKLEVIGVQEYADLLERLDMVTGQADSLRSLVRLIALFAWEESDAEEFYRSHQHQARSALRAFPPFEHDGATTADSSTVWQCASCEQIEAPRQCIGVCTRRRGEFVRAEDYESLRRRLFETIRQSQRLTAFVQKLAWVSPKSGQWERTCDAFRKQATKLLNSVPSPS